MTKLIKKLKKISKLKDKANLDKTVFFAHTLEFQNSLIIHLANRKFHTIRQGVYNQTMYIFLHVEGYMFSISLKPNEYQREIGIEIAEDSVNSKVKVNIRYHQGRDAWVIKWISIRKWKYLMRTINPHMIEEFLILIANQIH
ncbi:hypothetical protein QP353_23815 [Klebsiella aerogenes]|uniref:hypothetical protein n=1 Tax=Klebsiella aerogenes TaxID=548 RepID=UPI00254AE48E|nr:hypothetical protein [Klebsiella aerogenes]MDK6932430.1 hypothetical protein [Klebsiella aerogenes]